MAQKVCPLIFRIFDGRPEVLAFRHPSAGNQFVKGSIEEGELPLEAARRELREETGITVADDLLDLGNASIGDQFVRWHFFAVRIEELPDDWVHQAEDDFGHIFSFFWHPLADDLNEDWHPQFHEALQVIRSSLPL